MEYKLIKCEKTVNDILTLGLYFYKTHRENVYISDYDVIHPENNLLKKDLLLVIRTDTKRNWMYISKELLKDEKDVIEIIDSL